MGKKNKKRMRTKSKSNVHAPKQVQTFAFLVEPEIGVRAGLFLAERLGEFESKCSVSPHARKLAAERLKLALP